MNVSAIKLIQNMLKSLSLYDGKIDGARGPKTNGAIDIALNERSSDLPNEWKTWSNKRQAIAFLQLMAVDKDIDTGSIDGWWGPQTEFAFECLQSVSETGSLPTNWRDIKPLDVNPNNWPKQSQSSMTAFYGPHGEKDGSFEPPMSNVQCPWRLRIAWNLNKSTKSIRIHQKCADSLSRILTKIHGIYGDQEIKRLRLDHYGGSYEARKMRGGSDWSTHSWAVAIDWDTANNKCEWNRNRASLDHSDYDDWWKCWEEEGWLSLGRTRNFDWMHVQAAKL